MTPEAWTAVSVVVSTLALTLAWSIFELSKAHANARLARVAADADARALEGLRVEARSMSLDLQAERGRLRAACLSVVSYKALLRQANDELRAAESRCRAAEGKRDEALRDYEGMLSRFVDKDSLCVTLRARQSVLRARLAGAIFQARRWKGEAISLGWTRTQMLRDRRALKALAACRAAACAEDRRRLLEEALDLLSAEDGASPSPGPFGGSCS